MMQTHCAAFFLGGVVVVVVGFLGERQEAEFLQVKPEYGFCSEACKSSPCWLNHLVLYSVMKKFFFFKSCFSYEVKTNDF